MTESIRGVWKLKESENFDAYLKALGVNIANRQMMKLVKPTLTIEIDGNSFLLRNESKLRTVEIRCTIGEEFDETPADGRKCKSKMHWDGNTLVHNQSWDGKTCEMSRYREGDCLVVKFHLDKVIAKLIYEKK